MPDEIIYMRLAIEEAGIPAKAHRGEMGNGEHAEFVALERKPNNQVIAGATVYTTLEPCNQRNPPKIACAARLPERRVKRVVIGMMDPAKPSRHHCLAEPIFERERVTSHAQLPTALSPVELKY